MKMYNLSYSLKFAILRADAEAQYSHCTDPGIEYWFLGILKLSELTALLTEAQRENKFVIHFGI